MKRHVAVAALGLTLVGAACKPLPSDPQPDRPAVAEGAKVYAFCGVDPYSASADRAAATFADIGITATMGFCYDAPIGYSPAFPGTRYGTPDTYMALVLLNARHGLRTIVYDARLWGTDAETAEALAFWSPVMEHVEAWDMGDEFDYPEWHLLIERTARVKSLGTGRPPFTNHLAWAGPPVVRDFGGESFWFDQYGGDRGLAVAREMGPQVAELGCAVNTISHNGLTPDALSVKGDFRKLADAGCDGWLVFGGTQPTGFGESLVDAAGEATHLANAVKDMTGGR